MTSIENKEGSPVPTRPSSASRQSRRLGVTLAIAGAALLALAPNALADTATLQYLTTTGVSDPVAGVSRIERLSGNTSTQRYLYVKYRAPGGAPCAPAPAQDSGGYLDGYTQYDDERANGNFSYDIAKTWSTAGSFVFCIWFAQSEDTSGIAPFVTQTITFRQASGSITASITPAVPMIGMPVAFAITGSSETPAEVYAKVRAAGGAPCAATYSGDSGGSLVDDEDVNGAFSIPASSTFGAAGNYLLCLWLTDDGSSDTTPLAGPQSQPFTVQAPVVIRPTRVSGTATLKRRGRGAVQYSGKLSTLTACRRNRRVVLRRVGSGTRSFGSTQTRADGTFTIRRSRRLRGRVYVVISARTQGSTICSVARSRRIGG